MTSDRRTRLAAAYPTLFHVAHIDAWSSIRRHGLLSTSALLDLFQVTGDNRRVIETMRRPASVSINHQINGRAVIRDQRPLSENKLAGALTDLSVTEWFELLNRHVFLWPTRARVNTMLGALAYRGIEQLLITFDTASLIEAGTPFLLSRINSGATSPMAWPRGSDTFRDVGAYSLIERLDKYGAASAVAEVLVPEALNDVERHALRVEVWKNAAAKSTVWSR